MKKSSCKYCHNYFNRQNLEEIFCSDSCKLKWGNEKITKCKPLCNKESLIPIEVLFKNNTKHIKLICSKCRKGYKFLSSKKNVDKKTKKEIVIIHQQKSRLKKYSPSFYTTKAWLSIRYDILTQNKPECAICGSIKKPFHVDHIIPRSTRPDLELNKDNLQILCAECNLGKSNKLDNKEPIP